MKPGPSVADRKTGNALARIDAALVVLKIETATVRKLYRGAASDELARVLEGIIARFENERRRLNEERRAIAGTTADKSRERPKAGKAAPGKVPDDFKWRF